MTYNQLTELIETFKPPNWGVFKKGRIEAWFSFLQYYTTKEIKKVLFDMESRNLYFNLSNILEGVREHYGVLLHEEVEKARKIYNEAKKQNKIIRKDKLPNLEYKYDEPTARAWAIICKEG